MIWWRMFLRKLYLFIFGSGIKKRSPIKIVIVVFVLYVRMKFPQWIDAFKLLSFEIDI